MGGPMAKNLLKNQFGLNVFDLRTEVMQEFANQVRYWILS